MESSNELLTAQLQDDERAKKIDDVFNSITLLNLDNEDDFLETTLENSEENDIGLNQYDIKGMKFIINPLDKFNLSVSSVRPPDIFLEAKGSLYNMLIRDQLQKIALKKKKSGDKLDDFEKDLIIYYFKILFCNITDDNLQICQDNLNFLLDDVEKNTLCVVFSSLVEILNSLGCKANTCKPRTDDDSFDVGRNLIHIFKFMNSFLNMCLFMKVKVNPLILNSLLLNYMQLSMDISIIESGRSIPLFCSIIGGVQLILGLYEGICSLKEHVINIVNSLGEYLDSFTGDFAHQAIRHLCLNIIPSNKSGMILKRSIAYYALMCCLNMDTVFLLCDVTASKVGCILSQNIEEFEARSYKELYSMLYLIDLCLPKPIIGQEESSALEVVIKVVNSVVNSKTSANEDIGPKLLIGPFKNIISDWSLMIQKNKKTNSKNGGESSSDSEMDIY